MGRETLRLPSRETAARDSRAVMHYNFRGNVGLRMPVEQRHGPSNVFSGAVAVTVPCATRRLDELGGGHGQIV